MRRVQLQKLTPQDAVLRAGTLPGKITLEVSADAHASLRVPLDLVLDPGDSFGDGTPDFLRLNDAGDREAFRRWFTLLAEVQAYGGRTQEPPITDCAALIRFAYREALREHTGEWASSLALPAIAAPAIAKYSYPYTALGAALFRVQPGSFRAADIGNGAFAEFADADTLRRFNTYLIGHEMQQARPGDLLFFHQENQRMPYHAMIYLGRSQLETNSEPYLIYHTGPNTAGRHTDPGEIRRLTVNDLLRHPEARWRPVPQNPAFLGVYRWNILRGTD
jgi:hypothetical protein